MKRLLLATCIAAAGIVGTASTEGGSAHAAASALTWTSSDPGSSVSAGTQPNQIVLSYNGNNAYTYNQIRLWTFTTVAPLSGTYHFAYTFSGCHGWYMTRDYLAAFVNHGGAVTTTGLVNRGGGCGFVFSGTVALTVASRDTIGFQVGGTNYDGSRLLNGSLTLTVTPPDTSAPTTTAALAGTAGTNGWYVSPVTFSLNPNDPDGATDVASTKYSLNGGTTWLPYSTSRAFGGPSASPDGTYTVQYYSVDKAGNQQATQQVSFKVDTTPPTVTYTGNQRTYTINQNVSISCVAADPGAAGAASGVASSTCANVNASAASLGLGVHSLSATATDNAGNTGTGTASFTIIVTFGSLISLTQDYVTDPGVASILVTLLKHAEMAPAGSSQRAQLVHLYITGVQDLARTGRLTATQAATLTTAAYTL